MNQWKEILEYCLNKELGKIILSNPRKKDGLRKVEIRPVLLKHELKFQRPLSDLFYLVLLY